MGACRGELGLVVRLRAKLRMSIIGLSHRWRIDLGAVCKAGYNQHASPLITLADILFLFGMFNVSLS